MVAWYQSRKHFAEKELEDLFSPLYEIMDRAVKKSSKVFLISDEDYEMLGTILLRYGHYLKSQDHVELKSLFFHPHIRHVNGFRQYPAENFRKCKELVEKNRRKLMKRLWGHKESYREPKNRLNL